MRDARSIAAIILAGGVAIAIITIALGATIHRGPIAPDESTLIATVLGAAIGAVATFLGLHQNGKT
jgi:hypothetical protein